MGVCRTREQAQQACLQPLTTESSKANSEGDMIHYYCVIYSSLFLKITSLDQT